MGRPKATLRWGRESFVSKQLRSMAEAGVAPLVLVCGEHARETRAALPHDVAVRVLHNPAPELGQLSSHKVALTEIQSIPSVKGALVGLVDHPAVRVSTMLALCRAAREDLIVLPRYQGRRGHPVVFGSSIFSELLAAADDKGARPVVRRNPERRIEIDVSDPGILVDIDTPGELEAARATADRTPRG